MKRLAAVLVMVFCLPALALAAEESGAVVKAPINPEDTVSLQRGAQLFVNYCMGCHSLKYVRYERTATDLKMPNDLVQKYLHFGEGKIGDLMKNGMTEADGAAWFGNAPPDLSLEARHRSPDWIYSYLLGFYKDASRPYGYNNKVFPKVGMPNVLAPLEAQQGEEQYRQSVADLTNFLAYVADPSGQARKHLGAYVLAFLVILLIPLYLLKREYWKDIH